MLDDLEHVTHATLSRGGHDPSENAENGPNLHREAYEAGEITEDGGQSRPNDIKGEKDDDVAGIGGDGSYQRPKGRRVRQTGRMVNDGLEVGWKMQQELIDDCAIEWSA